ncbi:hypothetical protein [Mesomycoplasma molare]|uniref:Uncharacterized protein n=1 Tax=Mesomycoplasma molare TaxID=171288 RepID=A0ABY5TTN0_9BACT|nr:hypothetical protein [Mesomycoplasma molare]UWD34027.1 hypothetical protein NX772_02890 [Mesomycoplasma molare]
MKKLELIVRELKRLETLKLTKWNQLSIKEQNRITKELKSEMKLIEAEALKIDQENKSKFTKQINRLFDVTYNWTPELIESAIDNIEATEITTPREVFALLKDMNREFRR